MDAKKLLREYRNILREIERIEDELATWQARAEKCTTSFSAVPGGGGDGDKIQVAVEQMDAIREKLNARLVKLTDARDNAERIIKSVSDLRLRLILEYRYIDGLTYDEIGLRMNYSFRQIFRLHKWALSEAEKMA